MDRALELAGHDPEGALRLVADLDDAALRQALAERIQAAPENAALRFAAACLFLQRGLLQPAIMHLQRTVQVPEFELASYARLGRAFVQDPRFGIDMALRQFRKGLQSKGHPAGEYLSLRYDLAMLLYRQGRLHEAVPELKQIVAVDVTFRHALELQKLIEQERDGPFPPGPPAVAVGLPRPPVPLTRAVGKRWPKGRP